jgi:DNA-binding beta-propeller fold protein YncE
VNYLITGSVENDGKFTIRFTPRDEEIEIVEHEFDPEKFFAEYRDGWNPAKPKPFSWTAQGQISGLSNADGKFIVGSNGEQGPRIAIIDPRTRTTIGQIRPAARVNALFYDDESDILAAALSDRIVLYDKNLVEKLDIPISADEPISVAAAGDKLLVTCNRGKVFVFDTKTGSPVALPQPFNTKGQPARAAVSPDKTLFGICAGDKAYIFPTTNLRLKQTITGDSPFNDIAFGADDHVLLATEFGTEEYAGETLLRTIAEGERANAVGFSANGILSLIGGERLRLYKDSMRVFTLYEKNEMGTTSEEINRVAWGPSHIAAAHGSSLEIYENVPEPNATLIVTNEASYPASFTFDTDAPIEIAPNASHNYKVVIPNAQKRVSMSVDEWRAELRLTSSSVILKPGDNQIIKIRDITDPKAVLAEENRIEVISLAVTKDAIIAAYTPVARGKSSIASSAVLYLDKTGQPYFLRPHTGRAVGVASNNGYIATAGTDKKVNTYADRQFKSVITLGSSPIGIDIDDENRLLIIYEDGVSIIGDIAGAAEKPPKVESVVWKNHEVTAEAWRLSRGNTAAPLEARLPNGKTIAASDSIRFKDGDREVASFALFSSMEWALVTKLGQYIGSPLESNHLTINAGPKTTRGFTNRDVNLHDPVRVKRVLVEFNR